LVLLVELWGISENYLQLLFIKNLENENTTKKTS